MKTKAQVDEAVQQLSVLGKVIYYLQIFLLAPDRCADPFCPGRQKPWSTRKSYCDICDTPGHY